MDKGKVTMMKNSRYQYAKRAPKEARTGADGHVYDSRTEMLRGQDLQLLARAGEISDLQRQVKFPLEYRCSCGSITVMAGSRPAHYTPDFVYTDKRTGLRMVEDVKGYPDEQAKLRIRVFEALYGQKVTIMRKVKGVGWVQE